MPQLLPFPELLAQSSSMSVENKVIQAEFDGYVAIEPQGLNSNVDTWDMSYIPTDPTTTAAIEAVYRSVGAYGILQWTPIGEAAPKNFRVVAGSFKRSQAGGIYYKISVQLRQAFIYV